MEQKEVLMHVWLQVGALHDETKDKHVALDRAKRGVKRMGLNWGQILARTRRGHIVDTRHMVSKYLRDCGWTYQEISRTLHRSDHSTSLHSVNKANDLMDIDKQFRDSYHNFLNA